MHVCGECFEGRAVVFFFSSLVDNISSRSRGSVQSSDTFSRHPLPHIGSRKSILEDNNIPSLSLQCALIPRSPRETYKRVSVVLSHVALCFLSVSGSQWWEIIPNRVAQLTLQSDRCLFLGESLPAGITAHLIVFVFKGALRRFGEEIRNS